MRKLFLLLSLVLCMVLLSSCYTILNTGNLNQKVICEYEVDTLYYVKEKDMYIWEGILYDKKAGLQWNGVWCYVEQPDIKFRKALVSGKYKIQWYVVYDKKYFRILYCDIQYKKSMKKISIPNFIKGMPVKKGTDKPII